MSTTNETLLYLEACNLLFEQGFLSHDRVRSADAKVLVNIDKGFSYFTDWLDSLLKIGVCVYMLCMHLHSETSLNKHYKCRTPMQKIHNKNPTGIVNTFLSKKVDLKCTSERFHSIFNIVYQKKFFGRSKLSTYIGHTKVFSVMAK